MTLRLSKSYGPCLLGASFLVLAACGGSDPAPADDSPEPPAETTEMDAGDDETMMDEAEETADAAAEEVEETTSEMADAAEEAAEDVADAADEAGEEVTTVEIGSEAYEEINAEQVSAEVIEQYNSLTGDPRQGRREFTVCMSCHVVQPGQNRVGPTLYNIIGREAGTIEGFNYSDANANSGIIWTEATMFAYLEDPQAYIPGTIMAYPGLPDPQKRADIIAYIKQESGQ